MRGNNLLKILSFIPGGLKCVSKILPRLSELLCHIGWIKIFFKKQKQTKKNTKQTNKQQQKALTLSHHRHLLMLRTYEKWISADYVFYKFYLWLDVIWSHFWILKLGYIINSIHSLSIYKHLISCIWIDSQSFYCLRTAEGSVINMVFLKSNEKYCFK